MGGRKPAPYTTCAVDTEEDRFRFRAGMLRQAQKQKFFGHKVLGQLPSRCAPLNKNGYR